MRNITESQIYLYLKEVDASFPIHLSNKVDLEDYARKLNSKATICVEQKDGKIIGMVAGYTDNIVNNMAYIALVSVAKEARNLGIAKKLVTEFLMICKRKGIKGVHLYTDTNNVIAKSLYESIGFKTFKEKCDPRPADVHMRIFI